MALPWLKTSSIQLFRPSNADNGAMAQKSHLFAAWPGNLTSAPSPLSRLTTGWSPWAISQRGAVPVSTSKRGAKLDTSAGAAAARVAGGRILAAAQDLSAGRQYLVRRLRLVALTLVRCRGPAKALRQLARDAIAAPGYGDPKGYLPLRGNWPSVWRNAASPRAPTISC